MRKRGKNYLITTEKHEVTIIRGGRPSIERGFCLACAGEVDVVSFDQAAAILSSGGLELVRQIESGAVHSLETSGGFGVCRRSLEEERRDVE